jgi:hypothetical protein
MDEATEWVIVAHSLGGLIADQALWESFKNPATGFDVSKVKAVILISAPVKGTPIADKILEWSNSVLGEYVFPIWNVNSMLLRELTQGRKNPPVPGIKYYYEAGDVPIIESLSKVIFGEVTNDGVVPTENTGVTEGTACVDAFVLGYNHKDMIDAPEAQRQFELVIAENTKETEDAKPGQNIYGRTRFECEGNAVVYWYGDLRGKEAAPVPGGCGCGNGVCNIDENEETCPQDCAPTRARLGWCIVSALLIYAFLLVTLVLIGAYVIRSAQKRKGRILRYSIYVFAGATLVAFILHYLICQSLLPAALLVFGFVLLVLLLDAIMRTNSSYYRWH